MFTVCIGLIADSITVANARRKNGFCVMDLTEYRPAIPISFESSVFLPNV